MSEPVTVVIPIAEPSAAVGPAVRAWHDELERVGIGYELLLVDDTGTDSLGSALDELAGKLRHVRVLRHETAQGFGASLRNALGEARHPLFFYTALNYPYTPADLGQLLERIGQTDEFTGRVLDAVSGCRTGRPVPPGWKLLGRLIRSFARFALGLPLEPLPGWLGFREHLRSWLVWVIFGDPLTDPNSAFKLFRKSVFDRFPIQSDGDFVHVELIAKATFTNCLLDELPLTPQPAPIPPARWRDCWKVFRDPQFAPPGAGCRQDREPAVSTP